MSSITLKNNKYDVLEYSNGDCYFKDKITNRYYFKNNYYASKKYKFDYAKKNSFNIIDFINIILVAISIYFWILLGVKYDDIYSLNLKKIETSYYNIIAFFIISIIIHEISHYLVLKSYGREPGKIKIKRYKIFITIITDTTDSYLLPRYRRFFVYYAGVMSNIIELGIIYVFYSSYLYVLPIIFLGSIYNMMPLGGLNTDGYYILTNSILKINNFKYKKNFITKIFTYLFFIIVIYYFVDYVCLFL